MEARGTSCVRPAVRGGGIKHGGQGHRLCTSSCERRWDQACRPGAQGAYKGSISGRVASRYIREKDYVNLEADGDPKTG